MSRAAMLLAVKRVMQEGESISSKRKNIMAIYECSLMSGNTESKRESRYAVNAMIVALVA